MEIQIAGSSLVPQRIFCIGRNYARHAAELGNAVPDEPVVFMKPVTSLVSGESILHPTHGKSLHHEGEVVVIVGRELGPDDDDTASAIAGLALGLDLTLRDVQSRLKAKGLPWERAKAFDGSATIGSAVPFTPATDLRALEFVCTVNGETRQEGHTSHMLFPIVELLQSLAAVWRLLPGDLIYTGTPAGVGELVRGDVVELSWALGPAASWTVK